MFVNVIIESLSVGESGHWRFESSPASDPPPPPLADRMGQPAGIKARPIL
jgi:hypothetical protein